MYKYFVASLHMGNTNRLAQDERGTGPNALPCSMALSPRPWGSPPLVFSPSRGVTAMLRQTAPTHLYIQHD